MIRIVPAKREHLPEVVEIWKEYMDFHAELDVFFTRHEEGCLKFQKHLEELIEDHDSLVLSAMKDDLVIGFATAKIAEYPPVFNILKYGLIMDTAVKDELRRQGTGELLYENLMQWFKSKGVSRIELKAASANPLACGFWKKMGFEEYVKIMSQELK